MQITSCNTQEEIVFQRLADYMCERGFVLQPQDQVEVRAMLNGHANAADRAVFEARELQLRIVKLDMRDVPADSFVIDATYSLEGAVLATSNGPDASPKAKTFAKEMGAPVLVCDGNNKVRATFDEPRLDGFCYAVRVSWEPVPNVDADNVMDLGGDMDIIDAGIVTLRNAYAVLNEALERFRKNGENVGSILCIENYYGPGQPIVYRTTV